MRAPQLESGFSGGHGSHWDAVLEDPGQLPEVVRAAFRDGVVQEWVSTTLRGEPTRVRERVLPLGKEGFEAMLMELEVFTRAKPGVATVYPHLRAAGKPVEVTPTKVIEWGDGLEAEVVADLDSGGQIAFFATDYFARSKDYRQGKALPVAFSAVAYTLGIISPEPRFEEVDGKRVDVSKAAIVAPLKDNERAPYYDDDFFLQGPATAVRPFAYAPWDEGALIDLEVPDLGKVPVFGRRKHFPHGLPKRGEMVASYSWLQGRCGLSPG